MERPLKRPQARLHLSTLSLPDTLSPPFKLVSPVIKGKQKVIFTPEDTKVAVSFLNFPFSDTQIELIRLPNVAHVLKGRMHVRWQYSSRAARHFVCISQISLTRIDIMDSGVLRSVGDHSTQFPVCPRSERMGICVELEPERVDLTEEPLALQIALTTGLKPLKTFVSTQ